MTAPGWWYIVDDDTVACAPPKCGFMSFSAALIPRMPETLEHNPNVAVGHITLGYMRAIGRGPFTAVEVMKNFGDRRRVLAIRDPVARFRSIWRDKCRPELRKDPAYEDVAGLNPFELMDYVEAYPFGDEHWQPQWSYILPDVEMVPFDQFNEYLGLPAVHIHSYNRGHVVVPDDRIRRHYDRDVEIWKRYGLTD